jgi:hypothetical protein
MKTKTINEELQELEFKNHTKESSVKIETPKKNSSKRSNELPGAPKINNDFGMWD